MTIRVFAGESAEALLETLRRAEQARKITDAAEKDVSTRRGHNVTALLGVAAEVSYIINNSVCPKHGTPECTCDPEAARDKALAAVAALAETFNRMQEALMPTGAFLGHELTAVDHKDLRAEVTILLRALEKAHEIINGEEDITLPDDVSPADVQPPSGTVQ